MQAWLDDAMSLASRAQDQEALAVARFLQTRALPALPLPNERVGYVAAEGVQPPSPDTVFIVPVLSADEWRLPSDDQVRREFTGYARLPGNSLAQFSPLRRAIFMAGEWHISPLWRGLMLLHEGLHAYDRVVRRRHMPRPFWRRESNARLMECRVLMHIGGQPFFDYLDGLARAVITGSTPVGDVFDYKMSREQYSSLTLDELFGTPISRDDISKRAATIEDCVVLRYLQQRGSARAGAYFDLYVRKQCE